MAVQVIDQNFGVDGHAQSMKDFRRAHNENSVGILNANEKLPVDLPRPVYDPKHPDNQWPVMMHHPEKGELAVGKNLKGILDDDQRKKVTAGNEKAKVDAMKSGYRAEPYPAPQVALMDPASEKKHQQDEMNKMRGQLTAMQDLLAKALAQNDPAKP